MRLAVVLFLIACVVVRWADAACGCPQHNGWATLVATAMEATEHGAHGSEDPAYEHACCSEGRAIYAAGARASVAEAHGLPLALVSAEPNVAVAQEPGEQRARQLLRPSLSRATLQVWRI
jgi:hypothetical protein